MKKYVKPSFVTKEVQSHQLMEGIISNLDGSVSAPYGASNKGLGHRSAEGNSRRGSWGDLWDEGDE